MIIPHQWQSQHKLLLVEECLALVQLLYMQRTLQIKKNNTVWKKIFAVKIKKFPYRKRKIPKIKLHFTKGVKMWMNVVQ